MVSSLFASDEEYEITTILGSCVALCLWDSKKLIGGMTHYLLPSWNSRNIPSAMYGDWAIDALINELSNLGTKIVDLKARIYGGSQMFKFTPQTPIGQQNINIAIKKMKEKNIEIIHSDTGGNLGRKIIFNNCKNLLTLKKLNPVL